MVFLMTLTPFLLILLVSAALTIKSFMISICPLYDAVDSGVHWNAQFIWERPWKSAAIDCYFLRDLYVRKAFLLQWIFDNFSRHSA